MGFRYREVNTDLRWQRNAALGVAGVATVFAGWGFWGWTLATRELPALHLAPNIVQGTVARPGEVPDPNVYGFALYTWQQVNRWAERWEGRLPGRHLPFFGVPDAAVS